ncbi:MAG: dihydrolipoyl dehydrogenase [Propionibacteriaceae bacterium]|jgi:dihydrolipoamide dehydrogenase|nr:dihydrolipoyl dehydrogenase [Propionibacteriaceae bacterium]
MPDVDVIILGGGPGGYIAAERLSQAGKSVLVVEKESLGGTCLNVGCIPTKALLHCVKEFDQIAHAARFGVRADTIAYDWSAMQAWKDKTVATLVGGVTGMLKRAGVRVVTGAGRLVSPDTVTVGDQTFRASDVIIATGSVPAIPPIPGVAGNPAVVDSTGLLSVAQVPQRLAIIGGGVIGVEFASIFSRLGTEVTILEMMDEVLPFMDQDMAARLRSALPDVAVTLGARVLSVEGSTVVYVRDGVTERLEADLVLMAVGRKPLVDGWGGAEIGLEHTSKGVVVDDQMRTNLPHVWAVGDVTGRSLLAHAAYRMGEIAAALIIDPTSAARGQVMRWDAIPWAVYAVPEAAGVGLTQAECERRGIEVTSVEAPLALSGRYVAEHGLDRSGTVKLIAETESQVVRGLQIVGPYAPETIWGAALAIEMEVTVSDLRQLIFPHPTVSEGIREAAWAMKTQ